MTVGERIVARLHELGMKKADLVRASGVSRATVDRVIDGEYLTSGTTLARLAEGLRTTQAFVLGETEDRSDTLLPRAGAVNVRLVEDALRQLEVAQDQLRRALSMEASRPAAEEPAPSPIAPVTLGQRLRDLREGEKPRLSPERAAERAGLQVLRLADIEADRAIPTTEELRRIAEVLGEHRGGDYLLELHRLRRGAPVAILRDVLGDIGASARRVARSVKGSKAPDRDEFELALDSLDPGVRRALQRWCELRGDGSEAAMVAEIRRVHGAGAEDLGAWAEAIADLVEEGSGEGWTSGTTRKRANGSQPTGHGY